MDDTSALQKRVSIAHAAVACVVTLIVSAGSCAAWATSFQTKAAAAEQDQKVQAVQVTQAAEDVELQAARRDVAQVQASVERVDGKVDTVLQVLARRVRR